MSYSIPLYCIIGLAPGGRERRRDVCAGSLREGPGGCHGGELPHRPPGCRRAGGRPAAPRPLLDGHRVRGRLGAGLRRGERARAPQRLRPVEGNIKYSLLYYKTLCRILYYNVLYYNTLHYPTLGGLRRGPGRALRAHLRGAAPVEHPGACHS